MDSTTKGCIHSVIKEIVSGAGAATAFLALAFSLQDMENTLWLALDLAVAVYFSIRFSFQPVRGNIFGLSGAAVFLGLILLKLNGWLSLLLAVASFFGIRFCFHPDRKKVKVALPDGISRDAFKKYVAGCRLTLSEIKEISEVVRKPSFKHTILRLCSIGDNLVLNFEKDPRDIRIAHTLPDRLRRLHIMLAAYIDLSNQQDQSPQTLRALDATEKAVTKAVGKFEHLQHRLLENDAIDLRTNAKTFDNLLDFD